MARRPLRLFACLLLAGLDLTRIVHGSHAADHAATRACAAAPSAQHGGSHKHPTEAPPIHDSEDCQVCHFIATGSAAIAAGRPVIVSPAPPVDRRRPPTIAEPRSTDIHLPSAARAPPPAIHAA